MSDLKMLQVYSLSTKIFSLVVFLFQLEQACATCLILACTKLALDQQVSTESTAMDGLWMDDLRFYILFNIV